MSDHALVEDGELNLGRNATVYHIDFGPLDRYSGVEPKDGVRFRADQVAAECDARNVILEYSTSGFQDAWETRIFESPLHADEVLVDE